MKIHNLKRVTKNRKTAVVGRGGKRGKTCGRGGKGQTARAGHKIRPEWRDIIKKMPKLRGYAFKSIQSKFIVVNIGQLEHAFSNGDSVNPSTLVSKGILETRLAKNPKVKILALGDLSKKLNISGCKVSAEAKTKIEKAGGSVK
ncbi:MAG: 50S ribosomal protein L15 [bacterium]